MKGLTPSVIAAMTAILVAAAVLVALFTSPRGKTAAAWHQLVRPGRLSAAHAFLDNDCAACHTPVRGVEAANCIACHATNTALLQRQPTAFHADIRDCVACHPEHQGAAQHPTVMDHQALARIGLRQAKASNQEQVRAWLRRHRADARLTLAHPNVTPLEAALDCAACHATKDRHNGYFGRDCANCHTTTQWTIPEFRHPSPRSVQCAQCHQPPPSHTMEHFRMVSARVARQPGARVEQCYLCHQTTAWNDIKGVGYYKHH